MKFLLFLNLIKQANEPQQNLIIQASISFCGQKAVCWDISKPLKGVRNIPDKCQWSPVGDACWYDSLNLLKRENNVTAGYTKIYNYDKSGNITATSQMAYTTAPTGSLAIANGTITGYTYGVNYWKDALTSYNGTAITYDGIGNPLNWRNASEFVWSARELTAAVLTNGNTISYTYNADGIRTQKVYNGTTYNYILDGTKIIKEEVSVNGNISYELYYI